MDTCIHWVWNAGRYECGTIFRHRQCCGLVSISYLLLDVTDNYHRGIIGPALIRSGTCFGKPSTTPGWEGLIDYFSLADDFTTSDHPSPRYFLLWPGVMCMIAVSFTELACQWHIFYLSGKTLYGSVKTFISRVRSQKLPTSRPQDDDSEWSHKLVKDTAEPHELVHVWMWLPGLICILIMTCWVMRVQYDMPIAEVLLALFLAFFFSFLAIQSTGATGK